MAVTTRSNQSTARVALLSAICILVALLGAMGYGLITQAAPKPLSIAESYAVLPTDVVHMCAPTCKLNEIVRQKHNGEEITDHVVVDGRSRCIPVHLDEGWRLYVVDQNYATLAVYEHGEYIPCPQPYLLISRIQPRK